MQATTSIFLIVVGLGFGSVCRGQAPPPTVRLLYQRSANLQGCPSEASLRNRVAARLGYDPFRPDAVRTIAAIIDKQERGLRARVALSDANGEVIGLRELSSATNDCGELASSITLAISIAIDPLVMTRPAPNPPPTPAPPGAAPAPSLTPAPPRTPPPAPTVARPRPRIAFTTQMAAVAAVGSVPDATFSAVLGAGIRFSRASVNLEGRIDLPATKMITDSVGVKGTLLLALIVPCFHQQVSRTPERVVLAACALGALGALKGESVGATGPNQATTFYGALGVRIGVELHLAKFLFGGVNADLLAPLARTVLQVNNQDVWATPPVSGAFALVLSAHFR